MTRTAEIEHKAESRIAETVAKLINKDRFFKELNTVKLFRHYFKLLLKYWSPEQVLAFSEEELLGMLRETIAFRRISGLLQDFTSEEMQIFDEAVKGKA